MRQTVSCRTRQVTIYGNLIIQANLPQSGAEHFYKKWKYSLPHVIGNSRKVEKKQIINKEKERHNSIICLRKVAKLVFIF